jgi:hypothetical protein
MRERQNVKLASTHKDAVRRCLWLEPPRDALCGFNEKKLTI